MNYLHRVPASLLQLSEMLTDPILNCEWETSTNKLKYFEKAAWPGGDRNQDFVLARWHPASYSVRATGAPLQGLT